MNGGASTAGKAEPWPILSLASPLALPMARANCRGLPGTSVTTRSCGGFPRRRIAALVRSSRGRAPTTDAPVPDRRRLYADMVALFQREDLRERRGSACTPLPADHDGSLPMLLNRSRLFFEDLPEVHRRRESGLRREVLGEETLGKRTGLLSWKTSTSSRAAG